jgi:cation transport ATPase
MNTDTHKRILSILYIISGSLQIIIMIVLSAFLSTIMPFIAEEAGTEGRWVFEWIVPFVQIIVTVVILLFAIPSIVGGIGLLNNKSWAMMVLLILGCFKLFSFPIGTAIGVYTIWVYSESNRASSQRT